LRAHKYFKAEPESIKTYLGGREVCQGNAAGKREYLARTVEMWERQKGLCAICGNWIELRFAEFDHQNGRGLNGAHRDDRTVVGGNWHNAAVHHVCNIAKASKRYHWLEGKYVPVSKSHDVKEVA